MQNEPTGQRKVISPINEEAVRQELAAGSPPPDTTEVTPVVEQQAPVNTEANSIEILGDPLTFQPTVTPSAPQPTIPVAATSASFDPNPLKHDTDTQDEAPKFPWIRTLLIGFSLPLVTLIVTALLMSFLTSRYLSGGGAFYWIFGWMIIGLPYIVGFVVALIAGSLLKKIKVGRGFILSIAVLIFSAGYLGLIGAIAPSIVGLNTRLTTDPATWYTAAVALQATVLIAAPAAMALLVWIVHFLGQKVNAFITVVLFVAAVALPWVGAQVASSVLPSAEEVLLQEISLGEYQKPGASDDKAGDVAKDGYSSPLLPTTAYPGYKKEKIEQCLEIDATLYGIKQCVMTCVQEIGDNCIDVSFKSGKLLDEHKPYLFADGKCDATSVGAVMLTVPRDGELPKPFPGSCRALTTPGGKQVYANKLRDRSTSYYTMYYFIENGAVVSLSTWVASKTPGVRDVSDAVLEQSETDLLGFIDTFETK